MWKCEVFCKQRSASHDCPLTRRREEERREGGKSRVRAEGRVGDGAVETKQKENNMKRFLSGKGEAGDAGGRPRPVTQRYTKERRDGRACLGVRHKVSEH